MANCERLLRADEIAGREHAAAGRLHDRLAGVGIGWIEGRGGAGLRAPPRACLASMSATIGGCANIARAMRQPHHADAAHADQQRRPARGVRSAGA